MLDRVDVLWGVLVGKLAQSIIDGDKLGGDRCRQLSDRLFASRRTFLWEEADHRAAVELDLAAVALRGAEDDVEQCRLTGSVGPDQTDAIAF